MKVKDIITHIENFTILNKTIVYKEKKLHMLGYTSDKEIKIHMIYEQENLMVDHVLPRHETNRDRILHSTNRPSGHLPIKTFIIDDNEFNVRSSSGSFVSLRNGQSLAKLQHFYDLKTIPEHFMNCSVEDIHMIEYTLESSSITVHDDSKISIEVNKTYETYQVDDPLILNPSESLNDRYEFYDYIHDKKHTYYIHSIELYDVYENMMNQFKDERYQALPEKDFKQMVDTITAHYPKGKKMVIVNYEIEEGLNLHFYDRNFLDEPVKNSSSSAGLIMSPDEKIGPNGLTNRICPVITIDEDDFDSIDLELLTFTVEKHG